MEGGGVGGWGAEGAIGPLCVEHGVFNPVTLSVTGLIGIVLVVSNRTCTSDPDLSVSTRRALSANNPDRFGGRGTCGRSDFGVGRRWKGGEHTGGV